MLDSFRTRARVMSALKLLAEERRILLSGRISELARLDSQREKVVEALTNPKAGLKLSDVENIRREAQRNQTLIEASMAGIQSASSQLAEHRRAAETMGTYTDSGQRLEVPKSRELNVRKGGSEQF